ATRRCRRLRDHAPRAQAQPAIECNVVPDAHSAESTSPPTHAEALVSAIMALDHNAARPSHRERCWHQGPFRGSGFTAHARRCRLLGEHASRPHAGRGTTVAGDMLHGNPSGTAIET